MLLRVVTSVRFCLRYRPSRLRPSRTPLQDVAALSKRLIEISEKIEALPDPADVNPLDEMADFISEFDDYEDPRFEDEVA